MRILSLCIIFSWLTCNVLSTYTAEPINPNASKNAKVVLEYLQSIQGKKMLAGQHVIYGGKADQEIGHVVETTGKYPALIEFEGGIFAQKYHEDYTKRQDQLVKDAKDYWDKGGLIAICWHWGNPLKPNNTYPNTKIKFNIEAALEEGTPEHKAMIIDLDVTAKMLKDLQEKNVPVLWRPLHEICGGWFWWSKYGKEDAQRLWKFIYNYYTGHHKLNNLLWVYSASQKMQTDWFPGLEYADVIGVDIYKEGEKDERENFDKMASIAGEKPVALTECDHIPNPKVINERGFLWNWFLPWHSKWLRRNKPEYLKYVYHHDLVITRDELPEFE